MKVQQFVITDDNSMRIGGKALNLFELEKLAISVPKWGVIPSELLTNQLDLNASNKEIINRIKSLNFPNDISDKIAIYFGKHYNSKTYAIRSSALDEDGSQFSFAGQFETYLHVSFDKIEEKIKLIWQSTLSERVKKYREKNNIPMQLGMGVIIQEMVCPDVSGVAFGANPVNYNDKNKIITAVYGLGEGLVSGKLNADTYTIIDGKIQSKIAKKEYLYVKKELKNGIKKDSVNVDKQSKPALKESQIFQIEVILDTLNHELKSPQDIEFSFVKDKLYILQTRPITKLNKREYILWDNSNIIESYPGITTPLTFSFIIKMYEMVYKQFVGLMGVKESETEQHKEVFTNTLGLVRGRVYYNLLNWYKMLAMLPGYSINAKFMENMMGVKEHFELKEDYQMSKSLARVRLFFMLFKMINLQRKLPRERIIFLKHLNKVIKKYKIINFNETPIKEVVTYYNDFENSLLLKWKAPLINDFFAMIWFGVLQKQTKKYNPENKNLHNDLLLGSNDIISVEPIHLSIEIANMVQKNKEMLLLFKDLDSKEIWRELNNGEQSTLKIAIDNYISKFGERCVGELKLETISYGQEPSLFINIIKSYVKQQITKKSINNNTEAELRVKAEKLIYNKLKRKPLKKWWFNYVLNMTRDLVSNRENLRYERTRGFGVVRTMFSAIGEHLFNNGFIDDERDVFYLKLKEIKSLKDKTFSEILKTNIDKRKKEFEEYRKQKHPQERFFTYGHNFTDKYIYSNEKIEEIKGDLKGIGASPGQVRAKVRVVLNPNDIESLNGDILVTSSTDPGWIILFPTASAIIVERGSLLSHSAIVSREMGIPCIVSVTGLLRTLKTGDKIVMDGSTGEIKKIVE